MIVRDSLIVGILFLVGSSLKSASCLIKMGTAYQDHEAKRDKLLAALQNFDVERFNKRRRRIPKILDDEIGTARVAPVTSNGRSRWETAKCRVHIEC